MNSNKVMNHEEEEGYNNDEIQMSVQNTDNQRVSTDISPKPKDDSKEASHKPNPKCCSFTGMRAFFQPWLYYINFLLLMATIIPFLLLDYERTNPYTAPAKRSIPAVFEFIVGGIICRFNSSVTTDTYLTSLGSQVNSKTDVPGTICATLGPDCVRDNYSYSKPVSLESSSFQFFFLKYISCSTRVYTSSDGLIQVSAYQLWNNDLFPNYLAKIAPIIFWMVISKELFKILFFLGMFLQNEYRNSKHVAWFMRNLCNMFCFCKFGCGKYFNYLYKMEHTGRGSIKAMVLDTVLQDLPQIGFTILSFFCAQTVTSLALASCIISVLSLLNSIYSICSYCCEAVDQVEL